MNESFQDRWEQAMAHAAAAQPKLKPAVLALLTSVRSQDPTALFAAVQNAEEVGMSLVLSEMTVMCLNALSACCDILGLSMDKLLSTMGVLAADS